MSAPTKQKTHILVTSVGSFLGRSLARALLDQNCVIYGISATRLPSQLLANPNFTLIDIDLAQPLPHYLPSFNLIFDLSPLENFTGHLRGLTRTSPTMARHVTADTRLFIAAPLTTDPESIDATNCQLLLVGDVYGPGMSAADQSNELQDLISQAATGDKIILKDEGLRPIYPAYIKDVIAAVYKIAFSGGTGKVVHVLAQPASTSLSVAYEIQSAIARVAAKDVGLFFTGPQTAGQFSHLTISTHDHQFAPKFSLKEGLKETFRYMQQSDQIKISAYLFAHSRLGDREPQTPAAPLPQRQSPSSHLPKIPTPTIRLNFKKALLLILISLVLTLAKTGLDLYLAGQSLKNTQKNLTSGSLLQAAKNAKNAKNSFTAAKNKIVALSFPARFVLKNQTQALQSAIDGAILGSSSLVYTAEASASLEAYLAAVTNPDSREQINLDTTIADFRRAYQQSGQAAALLSASNLPILKPQIKRAVDYLWTLSRLNQSAHEIASLAPHFTGQGSPKTYLVLLTNNTELRPGGGFIGNFAQVEFDAGRLKNITVEDIYTIDGQLQEIIEPPPQLKEKLGTARFYLRDSNWSLDFTLNAATARDFFKKETGKNVDGVIAVDLSLIQDVLSVTGPLTVTDYNEEISADNLFERGQFHSEIGFFPGSTQKRDFFAATTRALITKIISSLTSANTNASVPLISVAKDALYRKHIMAAFDNSNLATFVAVRGWNQPLPPTAYNPADDNSSTRDFLAISEANLGANKVNRFLKRDISYEMTIGRDADLVGKLTITYTNESVAETWPAGKYVNFLRVYVPFAAGLEAIQNGEVTDIKQVEVSLQGPFTVFAAYVDVPIQSTRQVSFTYRIPKNIKLEKAPTYELYVAKQPGTEADPFEFKFNLPAYLEIKKINGGSQYQGDQNITIPSDLLTDRWFEIEVIKK